MSDASEPKPTPLGRAFMVVDRSIWEGFKLDESAPDFLTLLTDKLLLAGVLMWVVGVTHDDRGAVLLIEGPGIPVADPPREAVASYGYDPVRDVHWLNGVRVMCRDHSPEG